MQHSAFSTFTRFCRRIFQTSLIIASYPALAAPIYYNPWDRVPVASAELACKRTIDYFSNNPPNTYVDWIFDRAEFGQDFDSRVAGANGNYFGGGCRFLHSPQLGGGFFYLPFEVVCLAGYIIVQKDSPIAQCITQGLNLSLTPVPQTPPDPRPKGAEGKDGKSTFELIARVTENGNPKAGVTVGFGVGVEGFTGGHAHGDLGSIPRPKGKLSKPSDVTDGNGEIKLTFFADEPAGLHAVVADCTPAGCTNKATHVVKVKVPDLIHIPPDTETPPRYTLVGNVGDASNGYKTFQHNITHYLTEQSWSNLKTLISTFIDLGWGQIGINDASLEWGGLFDIEGKWTTSGGHAEHRDGKQVDISFVRPLSVSSDKRQKVFDEVCASKGAALPVVLWHQNDGYAPHFHIYLTGQSVTGAKKQCSKQ